MAETLSFPQVQSGEWVTPRMSGYRMQCCDCGLIHRLNFRILRMGKTNLVVQFQAFRHEAGDVEA